MKASAQKAGRNDPCPCGSRRKYKQCHGKATAGLTTGQKVALVAAVGALVGGLMLSVSSRTEPAGPATGIWSPEHGHYH